MTLSSDLVEYRSSGIHGTGGFARQLIPAGTSVVQYVGHRIDKTAATEHCANGNEYVFCLDDQWDLDGNVDWNPARFINHSCAPNCEAQFDEEAREIWIVACREIHPGEELTFNYNYDLEDYREHPCRCGASACVGFMVAEELFAHVRTQLSHAVQQPV